MFERSVKDTSFDGNHRSSTDLWTNETIISRLHRSMNERTKRSLTLFISVLRSDWMICSFDTAMSFCERQRSNRSFLSIDRHSHRTFFFFFAAEERERSILVLQNVFAELIASSPLHLSACLFCGRASFSSSFDVFHVHTSFRHFSRDVCRFFSLLLCSASTRLTLSSRIQRPSPRFSRSFSFFPHARAKIDSLHRRLFPREKGHVSRISLIN